MALKTQGGEALGMPNLTNENSLERSGTTLDAYMSPQQYGTTRNVAKKSQAMMYGLAQRGLGSKSVASRPVMRGAQTLLNRDDLGSISRVQSRHALNKSVSAVSIGIGQEEKLQRSQVNIDKKMRDDFDRL